VLDRALNIWGNVISDCEGKKIFDRHGR